VDFCALGGGVCSLHILSAIDVVVIQNANHTATTGALDKGKFVVSSWNGFLQNRLKLILFTALNTGRNCHNNTPVGSETSPSRKPCPEEKGGQVDLHIRFSYFLFQIIQPFDRLTETLGF
jgi:hypothetical protein